MGCLCSLFAALEIFRVLQSVMGEEFSYIAHVGEDGLIHWSTPDRNEHTGGMSIRSKAIVGFIVIVVIAVILITCKIFVRYYRTKETRRTNYSSTVQRVSQQPIQQNVHHRQRPVTSLTSATVQRVSQQPSQLNVHNLQQPVTSLASSVVICPERSIAAPCPDADPPPPYEVAIACESYNKQIPYNSTYKQ